MPNVSMPNGDVVAFPDDMPREQIKGMIATKFPHLTQTSSFDGAMGDIGSNIMQAEKANATQTGEAMSEPWVGKNTPWPLIPADFAVRSVGKLGNALGGVYGAIGAMPQGALTASVENSGIIPATASAIKNNLVPDDPRFTANISPEQQHQIAQGMGGDLTNAVFMGAGGIAGNNHRTIQAGGTVPKPYNPITETIAPVVQKLEAASQKLPGILGNTAEGVSINTALGGVPDAVALRAKGAFAMSPDARGDVSQGNWDAASNLFKKSTANGAVLDQSAAQNLLNQVKQAIGGLNSRTTDTAGVLADFQEAINQGNVTPDKLHEFRQNFSDVISSNTKSKNDGGGINLDGKKALVARKAISDSMAQITPNDLSQGSPQAIADLLEGINKTAQAHRYDRVAQILEDAQGDPNAIKRGFTKLLKNTKGYSLEEIAAFQDAANRGGLEKVERAIGTFGLDLGRTKNVALPAIAAGGSIPGAAAIVPHGLPLAAAGTVMRQTGKYAARGLGQNALDAVMQRDTSPPTMPSNPPAPVTQPMKLLPAPQTTMVVNPYGQTVPITPAGREIIGQSPSTAMERPNLQQIMQMVPEDAKRAFAQNWDRLSEDQKASVAKQTERAWAQHQVPLSDIVQEGVQSATDFADAKGQDVKNPAMREALLNAVRQPTMQEIMKMKPRDARIALEKYRRARN